GRTPPGRSAPGPPAGGPGRPAEAPAGVCMPPRLPAELRSTRRPTTPEPVVVHPPQHPLPQLQFGRSSAWEPPSSPCRGSYSVRRIESLGTTPHWVTRSTPAELVGQRSPQRPWATRSPGAAELVGQRSPQRRWTTSSPGAAELVGERPPRRPWATSSGTVGAARRAPTASDVAGARTGGGLRTVRALHQLTPHPLELLAGRHLLGDQRRLDPVEQALEPADQLRLGHAELDLGGHRALGEVEGQLAELRRELGRQGRLELGDRALVDVAQLTPGRLVQRRAAERFEQLLADGPGADDLGR